MHYRNNPDRLGNFHEDDRIWKLPAKRSARSVSKLWKLTRIGTDTIKERFNFLEKSNA
jgi:hypothetical protein